MQFPSFVQESKVPVLIVTVLLAGLLWVLVGRSGAVQTESMRPLGKDSSASIPNDQDTVQAQPGMTLLPLVHLGEDREAEELIRKNWPRMLRACPGISKYNSDLVFTGLNVVRKPPDDEETGWIDVVLKVSDHPQTIPISFHSAGNNCFVGISVDGKTLSISKRACASLCKDRMVDSSNFSEALP